MTDHISNLADNVVAAVRGYIASRLEPFVERLKFVESRAPEKGERGERGEDGVNGKDASAEDLANATTEAVCLAIAKLPVPRDGTDGKSVDPEEVEQMVRRAAAALPRPADGKDADADAIAENVTERVMRALEDIPAPKDGKDADPELVRSMVSAEMQRVVADMPQPRDGIDGKSVTAEDIAEAADAALQRAIERLPAPQKGEPGADADPEAIKSAVADAVADAVAAIPKPMNGKDADAEAIGSDVLEKVMQALEKIPPPRDGKDADPEFIRAEVVRAVEAVQKPSDGRDGREGEPGRDALQIEVLDGIDTQRRYQRGTFAHYRGGMIRSFRTTDPVSEEGIAKAGWHVVVNGIDEFVAVDGGDARSFKLRAALTDGRSVELPFKAPVMIYRGVWREGDHQRGDAVTWGGHVWHCNEATTEKPAPGNPAWQLAVKAGGYGKSAYDLARAAGFAGSEAEWIESLKGPRGPEGRAGRDLTQMTFDGNKY